MKLTITLVLICISVFVIQIFSLPLLGLNEDKFFDQYAFSTNNLFERPWTIITSIFVHGDITHLLSNMLVLFFFGLALEEELGWKKTLGIFMLAAFAGQLVSVFYYAPSVLSLGASAGIFGLIGVGILVSPFGHKYPIPLGLIGIGYAFYNIIGFFSGPSEISYIAHFGGLFVGLAYGFYHQGLKKGLKLVVILSIIFVILLITIPIILKLIFG
ncbi:MAG: rhomboid family intramembrane serine protease [Candidatus Aenigmarchaeota archaeon]|nr:rhomboid family intramembrane serine protease [Candidatus Aenigmarchaeota archaeon]